MSSSGFAPFDDCGFVGGGFASFERDPETVVMEEKDRTKMHISLKDSVNKIVAERGLRELTSNYFGCSSYYYDAATQTIWEVVWVPLSSVSSPFRKPSWQEVSHLAELNHLTIPAEVYATQRSQLLGF